MSVQSVWRLTHTERANSACMNECEALWKNCSIYYSGLWWQSAECRVVYQCVDPPTGWHSSLYLVFTFKPKRPCKTSLVFGEAVFISTLQQAAPHICAQLCHPSFGGLCIKVAFILTEFTVLQTNNNKNHEWVCLWLLFNHFHWNWSWPDRLVLHRHRVWFKHRSHTLWSGCSWICFQDSTQTGGPFI